MNTDKAPPENLQYILIRFDAKIKSWSAWFLRGVWLVVRAEEHKTIKTMLGRLFGINPREGFCVASSVGVAEEISPVWFDLQDFGYGKDVKSDRLESVIGDVDIKA